MKKDIKENQIVESDNQIKENVYKVSWFTRIPYFFKPILLKYWCFGMCYFFIEMGLGNISGLTSWYLTIIDGVFMGIVNDLVVYKILDLWDTEKHESRPYIFFRSTRFYSLFINVFYGLAWAIITKLLCSTFSLLIATYIVKGTWWFREPFSFALVGLAVDAVLIGIKNLCFLGYKKLFHKEEM